MGRLLARASSQYIWHNSNLGLTGYPVTMACWFRLADDTTAHTLLSLQEFDDSAAGQGDYFALVARGDVAFNLLQANAYDGTTLRTAQTTLGFSANTWMHGAAVFAASNNRIAYANGGNFGVSNNSLTPSGFDRFSIGARVASVAGLTDLADGVIAEVGIWNVALTTAQILQLARGVTPPRVAPESLVAYVPLWGEDDEISWVGGHTWTLANGPTKGDHAPVVRMAMPLLPPPSFNVDATELDVTQAGLIAELESDDGQLLVTQSGLIVELGAVELRVSQAGLIIELEEEPEMPTYQIKRTGGRAPMALLPEEQTGYAFDPAHSWWSTVVPQATANYFYNPSFEIGGLSLQYTVAGWTVASEQIVGGDAIGAVRGALAFQAVQTSGVEAYIANTSDDTLDPGRYSFSVDIYTQKPNIQIRLAAVDENALSTVYGTRTLRLRRAGWQRVWLTYVTLAAAQHRCYVYVTDQNSGPGLTYRFDGWQLEAGYPTTYCDGDQSGWLDVNRDDSYYWQGPPHASVSHRRATTGSGGKIVYWSDYAGFMTTGIIGLGMTGQEEDTMRLGDGSEISRGVNQVSRDFTIGGRIFGCDYLTLTRRINMLEQLFNPDNTLHREALLLRYQITDREGLEMSRPLQIVCRYNTGLEGNTTNFYQQSFSIQFHAADPFLEEEMEVAYDLEDEPYVEIASNLIVYRDAHGVYRNLGTGATDNFVYDFGFTRFHQPIAVGDFTTLGGDSVTRVAIWDADADSWIPMVSGEAPDAVVYRVHAVPELRTYLIGGDFAATGGLNDPIRRVAYAENNLGEYLELCEGIDNGSVYALEYDHYSGDVYVGGSFTPTGATTTHNAQRGTLGVATWEELPNQGLNGDVIDILSTHDGYVYFAGSFTATQDTTITLNRVARYNVEDDSWEALANGFNGEVRRLIVGDDGLLYAWGGFTRDGDDNYDLGSFAVWNGSSWEEASDIATFTTAVHNVAQDRNGVWWFGLDTSTLDHPLFGAQSMHGWRNGVDYPQPFVPPYATLTGFDGLFAVEFGPNNEMLVALGSDSPDPTVVPRQYEVTYDGQVPTAPLFRLSGAQTLHLIENLSAEAGIYFRKNTVLAENDRLFIDLRGARHRLYSDRRTSLMRSVAVGASNFERLKLRPGLNRINVLCTGVDADAHDVVIWRNRYPSIHATEAL